jgi:hypothetical protein
MILRTVKYAAVGAAGLALAGGLIFGSDAMSYMSSSYRTVQTAVKDSVPVEFELQRAHNMLEDIIPEMQANVRLIAQEEVEIENLKADIAGSERAVTDEKVRVCKLRDTLHIERASYTLGGTSYSRQQVKEELARGFDRLKEAEVVLSGKKRLQEARGKSLQAAMQMLDRARTQKVHLEDQIAALESQYRLVQAASVGSHVQIDGSKLAATDKLIRDVRKRLDVAERVLAHEARFVQPIEVDTLNEQDLITQVDDYLNPPKELVGPPAVAMNTPDK